MKFECTIRMDNDAFNDGMGGRHELARLLRDLARRVADIDNGTLRDANGNKVGTWAIES